MTPAHVLALAALLMAAPAPKTPPRKPAASPAPKAASAAPAAATANDPLQKLIDEGSLKGTYNPVLFGFLAEEAKGKLPEAQRKAAIAQLVAGFRQEVKIDKSTVATAHLATAAGALIGGSVGAALSETMGRVWTEWVDAAFILQKAGYKEESAAFFQKCIQEFALPELQGRCTVGLAAQEPDRAFQLVLGLIDTGASGDEDNRKTGLRLLGEMAGADQLTKAQKDRAMEELLKRTKGFSNVSYKVAVAEGLVASKDARAVEALQAMTKGTFKDQEASRIATRGLFLVFHDQAGTDALLKQVKGGFLSQPADQVAAAITLIEGAHPAGFEFAGKYLAKKRKDEELDMATDLVHALGRKGGDDAKRVLTEAFKAQKPKEWLTAAIALQLLALGDESGLDAVKAALTHKDWGGLRVEAAVALGRRGDFSGMSVLEEMAKTPGTAGKLKLMASGKNRSDVDSSKMDAASALGRMDKPEAVPVLVTLLADKSADVRTSAADALADMTSPAALSAMAGALDVDYGTYQGRSTNPEQHAYLVRRAAQRFPRDPGLSAVLQKASQSSLPTVRFLAVAESTMTAR